MQTASPVTVYISNLLFSISPPPGVVFTNLLPDGSLPPHVVYKIRQNASFTPTTQFVRDRYWHPGPNWASQNYFTGGFVWIQVRGV